jgi:L-aspartate oxidase
VPIWDDTRVSTAEEAVIISHNWDACRRVMSHYFGIVRSKQRCEQSLKRLACMEEELAAFYRTSVLTSDFIECRHLVTVAKCMIQSALQRQESRGLHYWQDQTETDPTLDHMHTFVSKENGAFLAPFSKSMKEISV